MDPAPPKPWIPSVFELVASALGEERFLRLADWLIETAPVKELDATELAKARETWFSVSKDVEYARALARAGRDTDFSRMALRRNEMVLRSLEQYAVAWRRD